MISVEQALSKVEQAVQQLPAVRQLLGDVLALRLAEPIVSDYDSPLFDKALLDGYAVISGDSHRELKVIEQVVAGGVPHHAVAPGDTIRVMTGAPVPDGADAVVKHEDVQLLKDDRIRLSQGDVPAGSGILQRGASFHVGQEILPQGKRLTPIDIALLAEVGHAKVLVTPRPRVAVLSTGNELIEPGRTIGPGQICNSNGPMLMALLESNGADAEDLGIARDDPEQLRQSMLAGLEANILLVTGGVSAGVMDLVPGTLQALGVQQVFHKVRMKPGKPLWFGVLQQKQQRTLVFGLPGNPVSTLVSFELFVRPALEALRGDGFAKPQPVVGALDSKIAHRGGRPTYYPSRVDYGQREGGKPVVEPLPWRGSADLAALTQANALAILPGGEYELSAGEPVEFLSL